MKRRTPLQVLWERVECKSCADGSIILKPIWGVDFMPGVITRLYATRQLAKHLNAHLKRKK